MSEFLERIMKLPPKRLALLAMELQSKLDNAEKRTREPIAVIGMGCRFPGGANSPDAYWQLLQDGVDAISEIPASRWDVDAYYDTDLDAPGKMATRWGGFLTDIDQFDPQFFGISPREAQSMDPQQRLLLEVAWETLEHAGYAPDDLYETLTGVFVGMCNQDYWQMLLAGGQENYDTYLSTGNAHSVASGRLSYVLGLQGPSVTMDTACSSSLVAIHLAVQSLRNDECRVALAGGANAILAPDVTITLSKGNMMASDGRCKAFDAAADGFVRSEGAGLIMLKRLSDAQADGDNILAVIYGSAMNQDGRSNGITAPNGPSQESVIRAALANAGVKPADVSYIETHGTGTSLGDPIEVQALGAVLKEGHSEENPILIGSVKTNIGHLESASGVAGLMKLGLALYHQEIPPHLHLQERSPVIPWELFPIEIPTERTKWHSPSGRLYGGVSSFGFSGTNVHIILGTPPPSELVVADDVQRPLQLFTLSAKNEIALQELVAQHQHHWTSLPDGRFADMVYTANCGRAQFNHRLAVLVQNKDELQQKLTQYQEGEKVASLFLGQKIKKSADVVFLFTGQGSQYVDMGRTLYETQPTFRRAVDECDVLLQPYLDHSILTVIYPDSEQETPLNETQYTQPAIFVIEYALAQLWQSWGIEPSVVVGHSLGEYVAACISGVFSLADALKLIAERGRLMASLPANGEMAAVFADEATVQAVLQPYRTQVAISAVNGPESVVISGEDTAVQAVIADLKAKRIRARRLEVSIAGHSPLMAPIENAFEQILAQVDFARPQFEFFSTVDGKAVRNEIATPAYWLRHMRQGVQFFPAIRTLHEQGYRLFLEIGATPSLLSMAQRCVGKDAAIWLPSLRPGFDDWQQLLKSLAQLYTKGVHVDWAGFDQDYPRRRMVLPTYPFQRERYWSAHAVATRGAAQPSFDLSAETHPLLGRQLHSPLFSESVFEAHLNATQPEFLNHHRIFGIVILPSPAFVEMVLAAMTAVHGEGTYDLTDFTIHEALVLPETGHRTVQLILNEPENGRVSFRVLSRGQQEREWKQHATGTVELIAQVVTSPRKLDLTAVQARCSEVVDGSTYYDRIRELGLEFGNYFRGIRQLWRQDGEALARVELPEALHRSAKSYLIHPALLDATFHILGAPLPNNDWQTAYLLVGIERLRVLGPVGTALWSHTKLTQMDNNDQVNFVADIQLYDDDGNLLAEYLGLHLKRASRDVLMRAMNQRPVDWLYDVTWQLQANDTQIESVEIDSQMITDRVGSQFGQLAQQYQLEQYAQLFSGLDALCRIYTVHALRQLGWTMTAGDLLTTEELAEQLGVLGQHQRLLARLLQMLAEDGILRLDGQSWQVIVSPEDVDPQSLLTRLQTEFAQNDGELSLLSLCGPQLGDVLCGKADAVQLLFPKGSLAATEKIYQDAPFSKAYNTAVQQAVVTAVAQLPANKTIRILEIGAGTGSTSSYVLPILPAERTEYVFTDLSPLFTSRAEEKFSDYPFVQYQLLDIEQDPNEQGLNNQQFDIVIAANVIHATADLHQTLTHAQQLCVPGGLLLMLEGTAPQRWVDLTFGLTEGWWRFTDVDLRPSYPLLSREQWSELLLSLNYAEVHILPETDAAEFSLEQVVIMATTPHADTFAEEIETEHWLILADSLGVGDEVAHLLQAKGQTTECVSLAEMVSHERETFNQLIQEQAYAGVVYLGGLDLHPLAEMTANDLQQGVAQVNGDVLALVKSWAHKQKSTLWLVTQNAQPVLNSERPLSAHQATLWGLGRVVALEHPEIWGGLIDLDAEMSVNVAAQKLFAEIWQPNGEDQVAWRQDERFVARLTHRKSYQPSEVTIDPDGAYLLTGGLGGLGLKVAHWLAQKGAGHLLLTSRRGLPKRADWSSLVDAEQLQKIAVIEEIEALGTAVTVQAVDVSDQVAMRALITEFGQTLPPLKGVVHMAAALSNWTLDKMPTEALTDMLQPKVKGSWILHQLTQEMPLDFFVMFSSTTALWGSNALGHYAAANQFLDGFAYYRQALGLPALSINWGTWDEMRAASANEQEAVAQSGLRQMASEQALLLMGDLLGQSEYPQMVIADVDWSKLKPIYEVRRKRPFLASVGSKAKKVPIEAKQAELLQQLEQARSKDRQQIIMNHVRNVAAQVLGVANAKTIPVQQGLFEMGMDSLMSVELKTHLEASVGHSLPSTLTFNYPTVQDLAIYLGTEVLTLNAMGSESTLDSVEDEYGKQSYEETADLSNIDDFSEDELEAMLLQKLTQL